jgi:GGDEF domain-containing protein
VSSLQGADGPLEDEYQSLVQFLYRTPVGLIEFRADGVVTLMNPKAAQLLMPLASGAGLSNLFEVLEQDLPALRGLAAQAVRSGSVEAIRFEPGHRNVARSRRVLSLSIFGSGDETLTAVLHDATREERRQQRRVEAARTVDSTTGLPNRLAMLQHLTLLQGRVPSVANPTALIYLGVDRFQQINDTAGHVVGDDVLAQIGNRLVAATDASKPDFAETVPGEPGVIPNSEPEVLVARVRGDEFAVAVQNVGVVETQGLAHRLLQDLQEKFVISDRSFQCTCSMGLVVVTGQDAPEESLYRARLAMTASKEAGGHCATVFEAALEQRAQHRSAMEVALRGALERGELFVVYQPVIASRMALFRLRKPWCVGVTPGWASCLLPNSSGLPRNQA